MHAKIYLYSFCTLILTGCNEHITSDKPIFEKTIIIENTLGIDRPYETISLTRNELELESEDDLLQLAVRDIESDTYVIHQHVDSDGDGKVDQILFQHSLQPFEKHIFRIVPITPGSKPTDTLRAYSRFVPERTDDYAWENDRVAFRTYGPKAEQMVRTGEEGGTLSSGIDCWLKRVEYPVINKWYAAYLQDPMAYHIDTGEGLDNYHVGKSRGCGGIAKKENGTYQVSNNFVRWKTITNGPIRTSFRLEYGTWTTDSTAITEVKNISLDYGSNLSRYEVHLKGTPTISAGLTLHEDTGKVQFSPNYKWLSYWEPHEDSELGTAIVVPETYYLDHDIFRTPQKDLSNAYATMKVLDKKVVYYAGFGWKKSGQFTGQESWEKYLNVFALRLASPIKITIQKNK